MQLLHSPFNRLSENEVRSAGQTLVEYIAYLNTVVASGNYTAWESSLNLSADEDLLAQVRRAVRAKASDRLKYNIVVGIGGSNLGTKAVYDALYGYFDVLETGRYPKMIFADTSDPEFMQRLQTLLEKVSTPAEVLFSVISKSGGTTETVGNIMLLLHVLNKRIQNMPEVLSRLVIITDFGSKLWRVAQDNHLTALAIPDKVGGRYSVLSAVGLFPLSMQGIDINALREGARTVRTVCLQSNILENPAVISALTLYLHYRQGKNINDNFFFHPELESLGKWYRQLMGESVGKEMDVNGNRVRVGITPTVSVGSTDLHSMGQLYLGGPADKITTFVSSAARTPAPVIPADKYFSNLVTSISGKTTTDIMSAILAGVKIAYQKKELPFMEVVLSDVSAGALGEFMQFKMIEMMLLGKLLNVNTFDQPNVESYKIETKQILNA